MFNEIMMWGVNYPMDIYSTLSHTESYCSNTSVSDTCSRILLAVYDL